MLLLLMADFVSGFRLELVCVSLIVSVVPDLAHLHGYQQLALLPQLIEIFFSFVPKE